MSDDYGLLNPDELWSLQDEADLKCYRGPVTCEYCGDSACDGTGQLKREDESLAIYDTDTQAATPPIPNLLDTLDKQAAILSESVRGLAERLDKVLRPADEMAQANDGQVPYDRGGSNLATRLQHLSSNLGDLGIYVNNLMARLEL